MGKLKEWREKRKEKKRLELKLEELRRKYWLFARRGARSTADTIQKDIKKVKKQLEALYPPKKKKEK